MAELREVTNDLEKIALIYNPASGVGAPGARRHLVEELVRNAGLECGLTETDIEHGAIPPAEQAVRDGIERVLVWGGDGSVAEAAAVLTGTPVALAVLPAGTGNLLALNLGLPLDPSDAMKLALTGSPLPTDVGRANGRVFLIMAGLGVDGRMIRDSDRALKDRVGFLAYFVAAARHLGRPRRRYTVTIDGMRIRRHAQTVLVANLGRVTGGLELVPGADPESGRLQVAILRARTLSDFAHLAWSALRGKVKSDSLLEVHPGREILIETDRPQPVQIDGNEAGSTRRLSVTIEPGALHMVRPEWNASQVPLESLLPVSPRKIWPWVAVGVAVAGVAGFLMWRRNQGVRR